MSEPTPGPYYFDKPSTVREETGLPVASVYALSWEQRDEEQATGRLLAASWEMREWMKKVLDTPRGENVADHFDEGRALLAKIRG